MVAPVSGHAKSSDWQQATEAFADFQRRHRGTSEATISDHLRVLRRFVEHISTAGCLVPPNEVTTRHLDEFLIHYVRPLGRSYASKAATSMRVFLRYLAFLGQVPAERPEQIVRAKIYRLAGLPRGLTHDEIRRVLRDGGRRDAQGRRQYAMLMLLATYGIRGSDVTTIRLDDLHWRERRLWIQRSRKTGRPLVLPLTDEVGDALSNYVQRDRPRSNHREVFLSLRAPHYPLASNYATKMVRRVLDRVGVATQRGIAAHAFRHGFATRLIRKGVKLDVIAKCLDHRSSATTEIYTKLAIEDLRSVCMDPRVVLA